MEQSSDDPRLAGRSEGQRRNVGSVVALAGVIAAVLACSPSPRSAPTPVAAPAATLPNATHWARNSAEHRAIYLEVYRAAGERLTTLATGRAAGSWAVILDVDETVLDNSEYERRRAPYGSTFDPAAWDAWVREDAAPALPGAVAFTAHVHALGGRVAIVSNRSAAECPVTRENLMKVGIRPDIMLCQTTTGDKNPRFRAVQDGTAAPGIPPLAVLEWIGDNIEDFPQLTQRTRTLPDSAFARFGDSYFALPNAMYGSWQANPRQ